MIAFFTLMVVLFDLPLQQGTFLPFSAESLILNEQQVQVSALHDFYLSTHGEGWVYTNEEEVPWDFTTYSSGGSVFYVSDPCSVNNSAAGRSSSGAEFSTWAGVTCSSSPLLCANITTSTSSPCLVTELYLPEHNLTGSLPSSLGTLRALQRLSLWENHLTSSIPSTIGDLTDLTRLDFDDNYLTGEIPSSLHQLERLVLLYLGGNLLGGKLPRWLDSLTSLQSLVLNSNDFSGPIPPELYSLSNLEHLSLSQTDISGSLSPDVSQLSSLAFLYLWESSVSGTLPAELGTLSLMKYFYCYDTFLTGSLPDAFSLLTTMRVLSLRSNALTGTLPASLAALSRLEYLFLYFNRFTGSIPHEWGGLTLLQELHLHVNFISGHIPTELGQLVNLQYMYLYRNYLSGSLPGELGAVTTLAQLFLSANALTGSLNASWGSLSSLSGLDLSHNFLTGQIPSEFGQLQELDRLFMGNNRLTHTLPSSLGTLRKLIDLRVEGNDLSGSVSRVFDSSTSSLPLLELVDLSDNIFSGSTPGGLFSLPSISVVVLSLNCFSGELPPSICSARNCTVLSMDGLGAAFGCKNSYRLPLTGVHLFNTLQGSFPNCVLTLPQLIVLHLTGNGLTGSLSDSSLLPASVRNMSLAHNAMSGTIPDSIQAHAFDALDLSYNKFTGEYNNVSFFNQNSSIVLQVNRLSGSFPKSTRDTPVLDVINGNIFGCSSSDEYNGDKNSDEYNCGSRTLDLALIAYVSIVGVFCGCCLLVKAKIGKFRGTSSRFYNLISNVTLYQRFLNSVPSQMLSMYPMLTSILALNHDISSVINIFLLVLVVNLCLGVPILAMKLVDESYVTHIHQYRYLFSGAFTTGIAPAFWFVGMSICLCVMFCVLRVCYLPKMPVSRPTAPTAKVKMSHNVAGNECRTAQADSVVTFEANFYNIVLKKVKVLLPFVLSCCLVSAINGVYVYSTLQPLTPFQHSMIEISVALFSAIFNKMSLPVLLRPIADRGNQIRSGFFLVIFNNVVAPIMATALTSSKCFKGLLLEADPLVSFYSVDICMSYATGLDGSRVCESYRTISRVVPPVVAPYTYNYQCANSLIQSYVPVFVYLFTFRFVFLFVIAVALPSISFDSIPKSFQPFLKTVLWPDAAIVHGAPERVLSYRDVVIHDIMTPLLIGVTFGAISPLLAIVLTISTVCRLLTWRMLMGRFVHYQISSNSGEVCKDTHNERGSPPTSISFAEPTQPKETPLLLLSLGYISLRTIFDECMWPLLGSCSVFFAALSWDVLGDHSGPQRALWAPLACLLALALLWLLLLLRLHFYFPSRFLLEGGAGTAADSPPLATSRGPLTGGVASSAVESNPIHANSAL
jgi:Leucine-rich repeat (LRR) protein